MTDATGTTTRTYDEENRVISKDVPNLGNSIFRYDIPAGDGCVCEETVDPEGFVTRKIYDKAGRLYQVIADGQATIYTYYPNGNRHEVIYPGGAKEEYEYDRNNRVVLLTNKKADGSIIESYSYTYDGAGNQLTKTDSKGTTTYTYDSVNRLKKVVEPDGKTTQYSYDWAGNRTIESVTHQGATVITTYKYDQQNRLISTKTQAGQYTENTNYIYDANGNMRSKVVSTIKPRTDGFADLPEIDLVKKGLAESSSVTFYSYDNRNRLIKAEEGTTISTYEYN